MSAAVNSTLSTKHSALILFAHGARDPEWAEPFRAIQKAVAARRSDLVVELAFLDLMPPTLSDCVAKLAADGCGRVTVAPLFLAQGGHLKQDLPRLVDDARAGHPALEIHMLPAIGEVPAVLDAVAGWLVNGVPR